MIKTLFDPSKDIYRAIEKVITYGASQEERLKTEIREYIVTENIDEQFEEVLSKMQLAMEQGGPNEVGVWVSGFYGSGKSSFTKYLGLALDDVKVDGVPFRQHLQDRMRRAQTKALLNTVAGRFPAAVVMLDLAAEMLAGKTMEDVSTVLYYKVLQWAGYSQNLKVAALERRLRKEGRYSELLAVVQDEYGVEWSSIQNDPLVVDSVVPGIAHRLYPQLFKTPNAFSTEDADFVRFETDRVEEMLDIVREKSGKQYVIFVIDEVGQYVAPRQHLILNLDGLARNLKQIGEGKVWIIGTAQQTLTEDDPRAALNSAELYRLSSRFPIQIDLESSDIKEICTVRLLGKAADGAKTLGKLFDTHGQALRHNTKLEGARFYTADFDRQTFIDLYPFLPAHFDILLNLLGALAKTTGGIGLRSAIKIIQDVLVEGPEGSAPVAEQPVGWLATTVTLYDALEKDIRRASPSVYQPAAKTLKAYPHSRIHQEVAKTVAVLQILGNLPVTVQNVASLIHGAVDAAPRLQQVEAAVKEMIADSQVPFGEKDGNLVFFSEKLNDIDQQRAGLAPRAGDLRRIQNQALTDALSPLPSTRLHNTLTVSAGLKSVVGNLLTPLAGERETIQLVVEFVDESEYEKARVRLVDESRQKGAERNIFVLGRTPSQAADIVGEIFRSQEIVQRLRNDLDQEVTDYCRSQTDRATKLAGELQRLLSRSLSEGSFIFRGQITAVNSLEPDLLAACKKYLAEAADQVFDRYSEAPVRPETGLAEKFLRAGSLKLVTSAIDPLDLVQTKAGKPAIRTDQRGLVSIKDHLARHGYAEGKRLIDTFTDAPFGWSPDTLRYMIAALLVAGQIKLKIGGREVMVNGDQAVAALKSNQAFRAVGVAPRDNPTDNATLARAADRLTVLMGGTDPVLPLEEEIAKAANTYFKKAQSRFGPLAEKLTGLELPGGETVQSLLEEVADVLLTDASDAAVRLGAPESPLCESMTWAAEVDLALKQGLEDTVRNLQHHCTEIVRLPDMGIPGRLRRDLAEEIGRVQERLADERFFRYAADLSSALTAIETRSRAAAAELAAAQTQALKQAQTDLTRMPEWATLTLEEQQATLGRVEGLSFQATADIDGLMARLINDSAIQSQVDQIKREVVELAQQRAIENGGNGDDSMDEPLQSTVEVRSPITQLNELDDLVTTLQRMRAQFAPHRQVEITLRLKD